MACSLGCTKTTDIVYSSIFLAFGVGVLVVGIWSVADTDVADYMTLDDLNVNGDIAVVSTYVVTSVGAYMVVTSVVGIAAAATVDKGAIIAHMVMGAVLALFELATCILLIVLYTWQGGPLSNGMLSFMVFAYNGTSELSHAWDTMQQTLQCCGVYNYSDWVSYNTTWYYFQGSRFDDGTNSSAEWSWPTTCCTMPNEDLGSVPVSGCQKGSSRYMYQQGCYDQLSNWVETWSLVLLIFMIVFFAFQVGAVGSFGALIERLKHPTNKVSPAEPPDPVKKPTPFEPITAADNGAYQ